ncbi:MAG: hypothetical protein HOW73_21935 [Polyangiaceae bacterium]|nr:hypothetical protein [Polyangiaceae bacterium]
MNDARLRVRIGSIAIGALVAVMSTVGCSDPPKPVEAVTFETVCDAKYDPTMEKGLSVTKLVSLEGYLDIPRGLFTMCSDTCSVKLLPDEKAIKDKAQDKGISISLKIGKDEAQMEALPEKYEEDDLKIKATGGKKVGVGSKVRVTGERLGSASDKTCQIVNVGKIEAL